MRALFPSLLLLTFTDLHAQPSAWVEPFPPHKIAGNLFCVGSKTLVHTSSTHSTRQGRSQAQGWHEVTLGGSTLTARLTPGHTRGCTTWTMKVDGLDAVIIGSPNVNPGYTLVGNKDYPGIAADCETTFRTLKSLPVDLFPGAHGGY
jgi:hypothetical protein